ncbi:MFS transporter [Paenibacillus sp. P26]|nr:MFS transporter [Paenibacillus sp. P26]
MKTIENRTRSARLPPLAMAVCAFAIGMSEFVIMGILTDIAKDLQVSIPDTGMLISGYSLGVALSGPVMIALTNRLSRKRSLVMLMLLFALGNALAAAAAGFKMLLFARIVASFAHGSFFGAAAVVAAGMVPENKRAWAVSVLVGGASVANIVGVPFGTFLGQGFGWRSTFAVITVIGTLALIGIALLLPRESSAPGANFRKELAVLGRPPVLLALAVTAVCFGGVFMTFTYIAPFLEDITGYDAPSVSWILVLFGIGVTLGNALGGRLADWHLNRALAGITGGLALFLLLLTAASHSKIAAATDVFMLGVFSFGILPCLTVNVMNKAKEAPNLVTTINVSALHVSNAAGAWLGGTVIDSRFGLPAVPVFAACITFAGLALIGLSLNLEIRRNKRATAQMN